MFENTITPRLAWIADRVRPDVLFADVGTDHCKLPVFLAQSGKIKRAVASDIHKEPAKRAQFQVHAHGLSDVISVFVADGLCGVPVPPPADIAICGMGGETVCNILSAAPFLKNGEYRLLLQPMTDFACLRRFLSGNGFCIEDEAIVRSEGKLYQCLACRYDGIFRTLSDAEAELGVGCIRKRDEAFLAYVRMRLDILHKCIEGKQKGGLDVTNDVALANTMRQILEEEHEST